MAFFLAELGTTGSIDGSDRLLVRGKYLPKYIESLLRKYISVRAAHCRVGGWSVGEQRRRHRQRQRQRQWW